MRPISLQSIVQDTRIRISYVQSPFRLYCLPARFITPLVVEYRSDTPVAKLGTHLPAYALTGGLAGLASSTAAQLFRSFFPSHPLCGRSLIPSPPYSCTLAEKYSSPSPKDVRLSNVQWAQHLRAGATGAALRFAGFAGARIGIQEGILRVGGKEGKRLVGQEDLVTVAIVSLAGLMRFLTKEDNINRLTRHSRARLVCRGDWAVLSRLPAWGSLLASR
jgi:hypothetical protein